MTRLTLENAEVVETKALLQEIATRFDSPEHPDFLRELTVYSHALPRRLRLFLNDFRLFEWDPGFCIISGWPIDDDKIGDTPKHWKDRVQPPLTLEEEIYLLLISAHLGAPIGWATQQAGYLVHDICPIAGHEKEQLGTGCEEMLAWHTEDAFHPCRGDYLALLCMRNPDDVATTWGNVDIAQLNPRHRDILFEPRFTIRPDESHLQKNGAKPVLEEKLSESYSQIVQMNSAPPRIAILEGSLGQPYVRLDPYFMDPLTGDPEAQEALDALIRLVDSRLDSLIIAPGEIFIIDNFRLVHGRKPFKARQDGRDRWLKRINISCDLRKSRALRRSADSRVLGG
jgi:Fe(II)/alpha-ketoglutarate-dependent arginine beta-hydroxylase